MHRQGPTIPFRQCDLKRYVKGAFAGGASWARVKITSDGTLEISAGINAPAEPPTTDLDTWMKDHAHST